MTEHELLIKAHTAAYDKYYIKYAEAVLAHFGEHYRIMEEDPFYTPTEID